MDALVAYRWPGNIRELRNVVERIVLKAQGQPIGCADLPAEVRAHDRGRRAGKRARCRHAARRESPPRNWRRDARQSWRVVLGRGLSAVHGARPDSRRPAEGSSRSDWNGRTATTGCSWSSSTCRRTTTSGFSVFSGSTTAMCRSSASGTGHRAGPEQIHAARRNALVKRRPWGALRCAGQVRSHTVAT